MPEDKDREITKCIGWMSLALALSTGAVVYGADTSSMGEYKTPCGNIQDLLPKIGNNKLVDALPKLKDKPHLKDVTISDYCSINDVAREAAKGNPPEFDAEKVRNNPSPISLCIHCWP